MVSGILRFESAPPQPASARSGEYPSETLKIPPNGHFSRWHSFSGWPNLGLSLQISGSVSRYWLEDSRFRESRSGDWRIIALRGVGGSGKRHVLENFSVEVPRKSPFCRVKKWRLVRSSIEW